MMRYINPRFTLHYITTRPSYWPVKCNVKRLQESSRERPVEAVHHLQLAAQVFLCEMLEHSRVNETLHEETSILRQTQTGQPLIANPFMVHLTKRQVLHQPAAACSQTQQQNIRIM